MAMRSVNQLISQSGDQEDGWSCLRGWARVKQAVRMEAKINFRTIVLLISVFVKGDSIFDFINTPFAGSE